MFINDANNKGKCVIAWVESGHIHSGVIRELVSTVLVENAAIGVFLTLDPPTREMELAAIKEGYSESRG